MGARTLRSGRDLAEAGLIGADAVAAVDRVAAEYAVALTPAVAGLIDPADPADPIARQYVPDPAELLPLPEELADPIGDGAHAPVKGIVHRYPDRVLLKPVHVCPVYCRFCFRREMVGPGGEALDEAELAAAIDYIRAHPAIWEVILSGGDPLMLSPRRLGAVVRALDAIPHVGAIRLHTRVPVADPARVTDDLVAALDVETAVYVAIHANHARELGEGARAAARRLARAGVQLMAQTVLLKGVNDTPEAMEALLRALAAARIRPYYLHHGDLARGTRRFRTTIAEGQALMKALRGRLSGLCHPTYVLDVPGGHGKVPIGPSWLSPGGRPGEWLVADPAGGHHVYPPRVASPDPLC